MHPRLRNALVAVSLVNAALIRRWSEVLRNPPEYTWGAPRPAAQYYSLIALLILTSAVVWGLIEWARVRRLPWLDTVSRLGAILLALAAAVSLYAEFRDTVLLSWLTWQALLLSILGAGAIFSLATLLGRPWWRKLVPVAIVAGLVLSPLAPIFLGQSIHRALSEPGLAGRYAYELGGTGPALASSSRLILIVFDELDYRLTFEDRPVGLRLDALDEMVATGFSASHAFSPHDTTQDSIPALLTGNMTNPAGWAKGDTLFHEAVQHNRSVAISGVYHPYCRLFQELLKDCEFVGFEERTSPSFVERVYTHGVRWTLDYLPGFSIQGRVQAAVPLDDVLVDREHAEEVERFRRVSQRALEMAANPDLDFLFFHYNGPHPFGPKGASRGIYDAGRGELTTSRDAHFFDNLALADATLADVRRALRDSGLADKTSIIVTSDHGYRTSIWGAPSSPRWDGSLLATPTDHRVPLLVWTPGGPEPQEFPGAFNTAILTGLVSAWLDDEWRDPAGVAAWIEAQLPTGPNPDYRYR